MEREFYKNLKVLLVLLSITLLTSCQDGTIDPPVVACVMPEMQQFSEVKESEEEQPKECVLPTVNPDANFQTNIELIDFNIEQENKMLDAVTRLKLVINSVEFKQRVLNHVYKDQKAFYQSNGLTNEQVYQVIMEGAEVLNEIIDEEMDMEVILYEKNNSTVGYTYPNVTNIWVNNKFFKNNSLGKVAANLIHEWTHKLGFDHDRRHNSKRPFTVPYGIGTIVRELVDGM